MKSINHLYIQLHTAKEKKLIRGFEQIQNRDVILVQLKDGTPDDVCQKLKEYIRATYKEVIYVTVTPYDKALYIRYVI